MNNNGPTHFRGLPLVVVVAEEDAIGRATLAALLSCDGYRVFQAENLNAAISCLHRINDLTVLFADLDMPGWKSLVGYAINTSPDTFVRHFPINLEVRHRIEELGSPPRVKATRHGNDRYYACN